MRREEVACVANAEKSRAFFLRQKQSRAGRKREIFVTFRSGVAEAGVPGIPDAAPCFRKPSACPLADFDRSRTSLPAEMGSGSGGVSPQVAMR